MADEITATVGLTLSKAGLKHNIATETFRRTMTGSYKEGGVQSIGFAAHELLVISADLGSAGLGYFKNLDGTNYVELGVDVAGTFYPFAKILANDPPNLISLASDVIYAKANTAAVRLLFEIFES